MPNFLKSFDMSKKTPFTSVGHFHHIAFVFHALYLTVMKCNSHLEEKQTVKSSFWIQYSDLPSCEYYIFKHLSKYWEQTYRTIFFSIFFKPFLWTGTMLLFFQSYGKIVSFKAASNEIFNGNANDSSYICITWIKLLSHPWDFFVFKTIIARIPFSLILNKLRRVFAWKLTPGNTLLGAGVQRRKNE